MKRLILFILMLVMIPAFAFGSDGLSGKSYYVAIGSDIYWLSFGDKDVMLSTDGLNVTMQYTYDAPFGDITGIPIGSEFIEVPFYIRDGKFTWVASSVTLEEFKTEPDPEPEPDPIDDPIDLSKVKWLHTDVSKWEVTATLKDIKIKTETVVVDYDKACVWPGQSVDGGPAVNANPWVFVKLDGVLYAATWEWLKVCQTEKFLYAVDGSHIKVPPLDTWHPVSGETYYFMVSGLARQTQRNVLERSNLLKVVWP